MTDCASRLAQDGYDSARSQGKAGGRIHPYECSVILRSWSMIAILPSPVSISPPCSCSPTDSSFAPKGVPLPSDKPPRTLESSLGVERCFVIWQMRCIRTGYVYIPLPTQDVSRAIGATTLCDTVPHTLTALPAFGDSG